MKVRIEISDDANEEVVIRARTLTGKNDLGSLKVYIENADMYTGGTVIVNNDLGSTTVHVLSGWAVDNRIVADMGAGKRPAVRCSPWSAPVIWGRSASFETKNGNKINRKEEKKCLHLKEQRN